MHTRDSDLNLVRAAQRGDRNAFRALVERHQRGVFGVALGMLRNPEDARDACQEVFLRAHRRLAGYAGDAAFFTWLYRIAVNTCIDELRRRRADLRELDDSLPTSDPDPADEVITRELRQEIGAALEQLSAPHRTVLILREVEGLSYDEIASVVGCPKGTVMSRLFHARRRMQQILFAHLATELAA